MELIPVEKKRGEKYPVHSLRIEEIISDEEIKLEIRKRAKKLSVNP
jgi:hypothetical protein